MEVLSRERARSLGKLRYFTGNPCHKGHISERRVESGSCTECSRLWTKRWRENGSKPQDNYNPKGKELPSIEYLKECFEYVDGKLYWKIRPRVHFNSLRAYSVFNKKFPGKEAGHLHKSNNYVELRLDNKLYKAHRLIYKMLKGVEPKQLIDHIDGDCSNNRIENLREATQLENSRNSKKGISRKGAFKGVSQRDDRWISSICVNDKSTYVSFKTELEAALHYDKMAKELFGEFAKLNFKEEINND